MQNLLICVGKLYVAVIILYILVDNLYVLCEEKSSHRFYMYRKTSHTLTKAVLLMTSFLRIWEVYTYNFFPISLWISFDLGGLADSKQTKEGNHNFVWKSSLFASLSKWGQRKVHLSFQPERVEKPCDCNFSTDILLILLLKFFWFCSCLTNLVSLSPPITQAYQPLKLIENRSLGNLEEGSLPHF